MFPDENVNYQLSRLYRLIGNYVASELLLDSFFIESSIRINEKCQARRTLGLFQSANVQLYTVKL